MGIISGITGAAGSILSVGASVAKTVASLGKGALNLATSAAKSLPGKLMLGGGAWLALKGVMDSAESGGKQNGFTSFASALGSTIQNVVGGATSLFKGIWDKFQDGGKEDALTASAAKSDDAPKYPQETQGAAIAAATPAAGQNSITYDPPAAEEPSVG